MENIDKIIYINLDKRTDRRDELLQELKRLEVDENKIIRLSAVENGDTGVSCAYSHSRALELTGKLKLKNALILEDDFNFMEDADMVNNSLKHFFENIKEWDALLFSKCRFKLRNVDDIISICEETGNGCGYLVNNHMFKVLSDTFKFGGDKLMETKAHWIYANDVIWNHFMKSERWFCFQKHIGYQRESYSDIRNEVVFYSDQKDLTEFKR
jgi:glycosyl transferase family 25